MWEEDFGLNGRGCLILGACKSRDDKHSLLSRENDVARRTTFTRNTMHACFGRVLYWLLVRRRGLDQYRRSRESYAAKNEADFSVWKVGR